MEVKRWVTDKKPGYVVFSKQWCRLFLNNHPMSQGDTIS